MKRSPIKTPGDVVKRLKRSIEEAVGMDLLKPPGAKRVVRKIRVRMTGEQDERVILSPDVEYVAYETSDGIFLRLSEPPLTKIYVEPTVKCNLRCRTCMRNSWDEPEGKMDMEVYRRLLKQLEKVPSLKTMAFWGFGEPLTHPDIIKMIGMAKKIGAKTELITNGVLLDGKTSEALVRVGLDIIVVSMDGTNPESHAHIREGADLKRIQENIGHLNAMKLFSGSNTPELGIEFVLMRRNLKEMSDLPGLAKRLKASFIVVSNVLPYTKEFENEILYGMSASLPFNVKVDSRTSGVAIPKIDLRRETREPLVSFRLNAEANGYIESVHQKSEAYCPFVNEGSIAVRWDGDVSPCIPLMHSHKCYVINREKTVRRYSVGNIMNEKIVDIWNGDEFRKFRKRVLDFDFPPCIHCTCDMAEANEEDCCGSPFPTCGDCLWARGIILCP